MIRKSKMRVRMKVNMVLFNDDEENDLEEHAIQRYREKKTRQMICMGNYDIVLIKT